MPLIVNSNLPALNAVRNLNRNQSSLQTSLQRLSSGLRINSAKDDASGLAIVEGLTKQIRGEADEGRQVKKADIGLAQNMGGSGASSVVHILEGM